MGLDFMRPKGSNIKPAAAKIRTERVREEKKPVPLPSKLAVRSSNQSLAVRASSASSSASARTSPNPSRIPDSKNESRNGNGRKRKVDAYQQMQSDSDDNEDFASSDGRGTPGVEELRVKRQKSSMSGLKMEVDTSRRLKSKAMFKGKEGRGGFIHAADILASAKGSKHVGSISAADTVVTLQYPSDSARERYVLRFINDEINPAEEILTVAELVAYEFLNPEQFEPFNKQNGILRRLERAKNLLTNSAKSQKDKAKQEDFKLAVEEYNSAVLKLVKNGEIAKNLDGIHHLRPRMLKCILDQVYDRAVAPSVDSLSVYKPGTNNVYGELLFPFVSRVLNDVKLKSDQVFVDLGSGVGNVVLQAALEFGCESWGCEETENSCNLADGQLKEFAARCRLWGIQSGEVRLERGDFCNNQPIQAALRRADVILVNNEVFLPQLNRTLIDLFLECKDGCQIISLKSFVPQGHRISEMNCDDPINLLDVKSGRYYEKDVSWTDGGGSYYVATKTHELLKAYEEGKLAGWSSSRSV